MNDLSSVSIIILNYNGGDYLHPAVRSAVEYGGVGANIVVVDNASTDESLNSIVEKFPLVKIIQNKNNVGFSKGNNLGAMGLDTEYVVLLNNDAELKVDISPMIKKMSEDASIGVASLRMIGADQRYRPSAGYFPKPWRLIRIRNLYVAPDRDIRLFAKTENAAECLDVDWVEGSFLLTRYSIWEELRGLDESIFMYGEDVDFCKRVKDSGYRCVIFPNLTYQHAGGFRADRVGQIFQGLRRFHKKHSGTFERFFAEVIILSGMVIRIFVSGIIACLGSKSHLSKFKSICASVLKAP